MSGILNIASLSLNAFQTAFQIIGNNIANAHNSGYSRQTIEFAPTPAYKYAGSFIGTGVMVSNVKRNFDQFATQQVRETLTSKTEYDTFYQQALQIDKLLSQEGTSVSASLQNFFNALAQLNQAPDSVASRDVAIKQSELLVDQFNTMQLRLDEYQSNSGAQIQEAISHINQITANIADVNKQLSSMPGAPELLDKRDELLRELSQYTNVTVIDQGTTGISVAIGTGEMLVMGSEHRNLAIKTDATDQLGTKIVIDNGSGQIEITANLKSGMLGGLLHFQQDVLGQASQLLGQLAIGLASTFNAQHRLGMDMNSQLGKDFFTDFNQMSFQLARSIPATSNTGTATLAVQISDIGQTKLSDYELLVTDAATNEVRVIRKSDGQSTVLNWTDTPPAPPAGQIVIDGMTITVDNVANLNNDDHFNLTPTRGAARDLALKISDAREIAFASPIRTLGASSNTGTGQISLGDVFNTTSVAKDFRIDFISDTQFNLVNVTDGITTGPITFTPNSDNSLLIPDSVNPSYSVTLSGAPKAGDSFTASYNSGGIGDNRNGLKLGALQQNKLFEGGTESLFDRYSNLIAQVGGKTYQAKLRSDAADILYQQAVDFRDSKSAVNLDEEATLLLKFKEAYQAASKVMAISGQIMDVLFDAMR
ncbi:flagellar hook-associated protein FlgK [Legionella jordanis]|uniref:Flagellar hook-associated protein 1 n=1 Tax=Legionella jordanis TaxID=456 RepID=A0A0W0V859_9GAMM|nr:flagellar hook-associated protein FlgK [Legionella jordanis]KTD16266.1 flagellar hook-associated protein FlgK [Legionella jordanis]RMX04520.1 flagellar hook-associated protein FlgK [Legionella jordanis]VEH12277.1 flagellar hook-associated protein 1 FlgK [Legionella jordanis]HAT8713487.1 flagellar hook-associated protein FlgK [Legionella jordanis]